MKNVLIIVGAIVLAVSAYFLGKSSESVAIGEEKYGYEELVSEKKGISEQIEDLKSDRSEIVQDINRLDEEAEEKSDEIDEALEIYNDREEIEEDINEKEGILEDLGEEVVEKESEIAELNEIGDEPITLSAGHYEVGEDLEPGRYVAEVDGGGSGNFFSRNEAGRSNFGVTLGEGERRESEYVFQAEPGDQLELNTSTSFTEVE
ncbi:hypothetical protein [Salicibibacter kimchii]|uniref:DUF3552 domain-containing protein n=1 Tax=Salicibibacter kimchii TaxID=2099786 RepID=A0A345BV25_9BACI|nr:hypothetical protein [Salicibibacter kimchii]AXF54806.1 hypothetical protein DT065_01420 [Salicibibacter kimchii]